MSKISKVEKLLRKYEETDLDHENESNEDENVNENANLGE